MKLHTIRKVHELAANYYMGDCLVLIVQTVGTTPAWKSKAASWLAQGGEGEWKWVVLIMAELLRSFGRLEGGNSIIKATKAKSRWVKVRIGTCFSMSIYH